MTIAWTDFIEHPGHADVPVPSLSLTLLGKWLLDVGLVGFMTRFAEYQSGRPITEGRDIMGEARELADAYDAHGWIDDPATFHRTPPPLTAPTFESTSSLWTWLRYEHMRFESEYEPHAACPGARRWRSYEATRTAHAWVLRHRGPPRPWLVCLHGYRMGSPVPDLYAFQGERLHREFGLNVLCYVLPLHGPRRIGAPTGDLLLAPSFTNLIHTEAQAVWDLRRILGWIRTQGSPPIGVYGLSLGGYTAALLSTFEADLACLLVGIAPGDFIHIFRRHIPTRHAEAIPSFEHAIEEVSRAVRVVSPIVRPCLVPHERRFLFGGLVDRFIPISQVRALWLHWQRPRIEWFGGGHVSFWYDRSVDAFMSEALTSSGMGPLVREP